MDKAKIREMFDNVESLTISSPTPPRNRAVANLSWKKSFLQYRPALIWTLVGIAFLVLVGCIPLTIHSFRFFSPTGNNITDSNSSSAISSDSVIPDLFGEGIKRLKVW